MVIVPDSNIILLDCPLKLDETNQITFASKTAQYNYFSSLTKLQVEDATYQRKDGVIRFPTHTEANDNLPSFEDLLKYDYCMYQNNAFDDKWFYAYITNIKYINDGMSEISIETDVYQTWQFDLVFKDSFIEREHVADDTVGLHTIPEGLETGGYIINSAGEVTNKLGRLCYTIVAVTYVPDNTPMDNNQRIYNGITSGTVLLAFRNEEEVAKFIKCYDKMGRGDAISNIYMCPMAATGISPDDDAAVWRTYTYGTGTDAITTEFAIVPHSTGLQQLESNLTITNITSLNGYTPKNNKLKVFPYSFLSITNNTGTQIDFKYEDFVSNTPTFDVLASVTSGAQSAIIPKNYKLFNSVVGYDYFYNYSITGGKFPTCSWNTDPYTNWLTQNGVNIMGKVIDAPTSMAIGGSIEAVLGAGRITDINPKTGEQELSGEGVGGIAGGLGKMFNAVQENWRHSLQSPTLQGLTSNGDFCYSDGKNTFTYYKMSIKAEYARIIDNFFSAYGYKVNRFGMPQISSRTNWNYIKTNGVNILGDIPDVDRKKLEAMFNKGCTFWHTTTYFLDYSRTNSIVS